MRTPEGKRYGGALARLRKRAGLTQATLAERLGKTKKQISAWETGATLPKLDSVAAYLRVVGSSWREFAAELEGAGPAQPEAVREGLSAFDDLVQRAVTAVAEETVRRLADELGRRRLRRGEE